MALAEAAVKATVEAAAPQTVTRNSSRRQAGGRMRGGDGAALLFLPRGRGSGSDGDSAVPSDGGGGPRGRNNANGSFGITTDCNGGGKARVDVTTTLALPAP